MEINVKRTFVPVTLKINTEVELVTILGALIGYGTASVYAENNLKAVGVGEYYSGNVRKGARTAARRLVEAIGADKSALESIIKKYKASGTAQDSRASKAGSAVIGTEFDLAPGRDDAGLEEDHDFNAGFSAESFTE